MKSILIMIPYFGKLPPFFEAWRVTALRNDTIEFLLFTDDECVSTQGNVQVEHMSWKDFVGRIQSFFPFDIVLKAPYKICDFRPAFGEIFSDYVRGYDYWGYGDIDLLLGDLREFLTDEVLNRYERFFYNGHISLYRNYDKMNSLWRWQEEAYPAVNYQECYRSPRAFFFDEFGAMYAKCLINGVKVFDDLALRRDPIIGQAKFYWEDLEPSSQFVISWEDGKLYAVHGQEKTELIYAHFYRRKFTVSSKPEKVWQIVVVPGEVRYNADVSPQDFEKAEPGNYRRTYFWNSLKGTLRRNGIRGTLEKRKRDRDYWAYRGELERKYAESETAVEDF